MFHQVKFWKQNAINLCEIHHNQQFLHYRLILAQIHFLSMNLCIAALKNQNGGSTHFTNVQAEAFYLALHGLTKNYVIKKRKYNAA